MPSSFLGHRDLRTKARALTALRGAQGKRSAMPVKVDADLFSLTIAVWELINGRLAVFAEATDIGRRSAA
jgi:hypothetical protein